ncbi:MULTISPECIES: amidohydrolase [Paenibacillus]|uniref:5-methylthioadenosine/S-adenosylhomocysteine deaminase n=2 Tax=Paenibacillus lactis TaxID=228574 RepID=G4HFD2_9BACL|nr:amidohydrolase [Paenibacillus lactis]EHB64449.1 amidohydrolase [Paenibacillus lactis 154]MBP1892854.1 5-methylthioadenosine/S-adenosylhomocysteine deaminase [Paenibacillus lactis]HAF97671.1 amidohydrolase [Paenibacillus lactis]
MTTKWMVKNGTFAVLQEGQPVLRGYMVVEDDRITYLGEEEPQVDAETQVMDGTHLLFLPGLVNTHGHAAMSLLRGFGDDLALQVWLQEKMWPMEAKFTADDVFWGTSLSVLEMLKGGTTTFVDMYDHMDQVAKVVQDSGMRGVLTRGVIGLCPPEVQKQKLDEAIAFAKDWHGQAEGRITTMISPHAPYTCPPDFIEKFVQAAHDLNLPIHTHMSETAAEVQQNVNDYGQRPVAHLEKLGVFSRPTLVAHAVHLTDEEIEILAKHDVAVSHNPGSNLKLASGVARVPELLKAGVTVSLGTDGPASNNNLDMFEEMRLAALIHKGVSGDPTAIPAAEALRMGSEYGARSAFLDNVGRLAVGMKADMIALDTDQAHFLPRTDYISHSIYSASAKDVEHVWVDGKQVVKHGSCLTLDEERIRREAQRSFERLSTL